MSKQFLPLLAARIFDTPLMIDPKKAEVILGVLGERIGLKMDATQASATPIETAERHNYEVTDDGIAVIPVYGTLTEKLSGLRMISGGCSYQGIAEQVEDAATDPRVSGILFDIDSPGGETHGVFELCDLIYSLRGSKPIFAIANNCALSAAYAIASAADEIYLTRTGAVGSIGVYALHVDQSGFDAGIGVKYTYIHAGAKKTDGNPHEPLSDSALSDAQAEVDREYGMFVEAVSRNRKLKLDAVMGTEAGVYFAEAGIAAGLADKVGTGNDAMAALLKAAGIKNPLFSAKNRANAPVSTEFQANTEAESPSLDAAGVQEAAVAADPTEGVNDMPKDAVEGAAKKDDAEPKKIEPAKAEPTEEIEDDTVEDKDKDGMKKAETALLKSAATISNMCKAAGFAELAGDFIAQGKDIDAVASELATKRATATPDPAINSHAPTLKTDAMSSLESAVEVLAKNKGIKKSAAYVELLKLNPAAYDAYINERDAAIQNPMLRDQYMGQVRQRLVAPIR